MTNKGCKAWNKKTLNDESLKDLYLNQGLTGYQVAENLNITIGPIYRRLRELNVIRTKSAAMKNRANKGHKPSNFKGRYIEKRSGYILVRIPQSHMCFLMTVPSSRINGTGVIREHRLVMAEHLGRPLESWEVIHHKNGKKGDNEIANLELIIGQSIHQALTIAHEEIRKLKEIMCPKCLAAKKAVEEGE